MYTGKKGFIFIETVVVLLVLMVSLVGLYSMFSSIINSSERRRSYDNINDIYKVRIVKDLITSYPSSNYVVVDNSNCTNYMNIDCKETFNELYIERVLLTSADINTLLEGNLGIPNTMKEYLKTIDKNEKSIVVQFSRNGVNYYASLEVGDYFE